MCPRPFPIPLLHVWEVPRSVLGGGGTKSLRLLNGYGSKARVTSGSQWGSLGCLGDRDGLHRQAEGPGIILVLW